MKAVTGGAMPSRALARATAGHRADFARETGAEVHGVGADITTDPGRAALLAACPQADILVTSNAGPPPAERMTQEQGITMDEARARIVDTIAARRFGTPREFGDACAYPCSEQASFIFGRNLQLDGGSYAGLV